MRLRFRRVRCDLMGTACRMITTPGHETNTCTGPSDCDKDFVCLGGAADASCHKYCTADAECGTPRGQCVIDIQSGGTPIQGIPSACSSNCDPANNATPAACPSTMKCSLFTATHMGTARNISDCEKAGAGTQNLTNGTGFWSERQSPSARRSREPASGCRTATSQRGSRRCSLRRCHGNRRP